MLCYIMLIYNFYLKFVSLLSHFLDSDILNFLLKSPKLIRIGDYICVPQAIQQMFLLFEHEVIQQYKFVLQSESNEHEVTTSEGIINCNYMSNPSFVNIKNEIINNVILKIDLQIMKMFYI